jgi:hypothetical protein
VTRLALVVAVALAALAAAAGRAGATNECKGLMVCVRVPGPWVVVPAGRTTPRVPVQYQLSCPRGFVVGGLDAELSVRAIDLDFSGLLGSPVNPGVTTAQAALFRAAYTGTGPATPTFRPHLGCIPVSGGGGGPVPFRAPDSFPPGQPTVRRVHNVRVHAGVTRAVAKCVAGERLVSGWHALAFNTPQAPSAALVQSVSATRNIRGNSVVVRVRAPAATSALVQVGAVCGGGS